MLTQHEGQVDCYMRLPGGDAKSTAAFNGLMARKVEIEAKFGEALDWQELPGKQGSRISKELVGGWKSPESDWSEMQDRLIDALIRLEAALKKPIQDLAL